MFQATNPTTPLISATTATCTVGVADAATSGREKSRRARRLRASSKGTYLKSVQSFLRFGGTIPCDPDAVLRHVELLRTRKITPASAKLRIHAIQRAHVDGGHPSPTDDPRVRQAMRWLAASCYPPKPGSKSAKAEPVPVKREPRSAKPVTRALLLKMLDAMGRNSLDRRDRAMLLTAFMAGLKRQKLVALDVNDVSFTAEAMLLKVRGEDDATTRTLAVPATGGVLCAALAVKQYVEHLALEDGALFRSFDRGGAHTDKRLAAAFVSCVLKARLTTVGVDAKLFSGESLRHGRALETMPGAL